MPAGVGRMKQIPGIPRRNNYKTWGIIGNRVEGKQD